MSETRYDSQSWSQQAKEARRLVQFMGEPYTKLQMLMIAEAYTHLAQRALDQSEAKMNSVPAC